MTKAEILKDIKKLQLFYKGVDIRLIPEGLYIESWADRNDRVHPIDMYGCLIKLEENNNIRDVLRRIRISATHYLNNDNVAYKYIIGIGRSYDKQIFSFDKSFFDGSSGFVEPQKAKRYENSEFDNVARTIKESWPKKRVFVVALPIFKKNIFDTAGDDYLIIRP